MLGAPVALNSSDPSLLPQPFRALKPTGIEDCLHLQERLAPCEKSLEEDNEIEYGGPQ
jgi:hypothetical protein